MEYSTIKKNKDILFMTNAYEQLHNLPISERTEEYTYILFIIQEYIRIYNEQKEQTENKCNHKIIPDYIDIDPDRSKQIFYCEYCNTLSDVSHE